MEKIIVEFWYVLVLIAAVLHSIWNFMLKRSENKQIFLWSLLLWSIIIFLPISIYFWPNTISIKHLVFWGVGSAIIHSIYSLFLIKAYEKSDFTVAYPIARGTGSLIVIIIGITILKEDVEIITILGTLLIIFGIYILYSGLNLRNGIKTFNVIKDSPWPVLVGITIASYTIFDKLAVSFIPPIILYVIENIGQAIVLGSSIHKQGKKTIYEQWRKHWYKMALAGLFAGLAYILVLIVLTEIPVSYVSPIRETSIVIGSVIGFVFLKEKFSIQKLFGSIVIFIGVVLIIT